MTSFANDLSVYGRADALASIPAKGHKFIDLDALDFIRPISGGERGYNTAGDVITQTVDGRDLNELWAEYQATVNIANERRQAIVDFLTFPVIREIEDVPQGGSADFEVASEFGVPKSARATLGYFSLGYDFEWYDMAIRYTWKFLAEVTAQQVDAQNQMALEADNRNVFTGVMRAIFNNVNREADINGRAYNVFALYNGDGTVPPTNKATAFAGSHSHYLVSGGAAVDPGDVEALINTIEEHGYTRAAGTQMVVMVNKAQGDVIRNFRFGVATNGTVANFDFIPATNQPTLIVPNATGLIGGPQPAGQIAGMLVIGSYADALIVQEDYIPVGYMMAFGTGGEANLSNPVGFREHANVGLRGLRLLPGDRQAYPLVNSYYSRGFGTGIRQRGAAAVMQIKASGSYQIPALYV